MIRKIIRILKRIIYVSRNPLKCWEIIKDENYLPAWYFKNFILPVIIAISATTFVGYLLFALTIHNFSILYAFIKAIAVSCESFFSFYVGFIIINELREKLKAEIDTKDLFKIMLHSFGPFWLSMILSGVLANYATLSSFIRFLGAFYGFILFLAALDQLKLVDPKRRTMFTAISSGIVFIIYHLIGWSFSFILKAIQYSNLLQG